MSQWSEKPTVCFLLGLAGSGKSHLAAEMAWYRHFDENFAADFKQQHELIRLLKEGHSCTVSEGTFTRAEARLQLLEWLHNLLPNLEVQWICFENDLETANWNCRQRTNKEDPEGHVHINETYLHSTYTYPEGAEIRKIYRLPEQKS